ncbi:MAG: peptide chain release factor N(5)-glutamine methyltransferase [Muribaculaceae bacterium]|nr:peptide chain release factor N(5)-glutamine methyltransferase [Muribaculaceae bacterium]
MTLSQLQHTLIETLAAALDRDEAEATARIILEDAAGYTPLDVALHADREPEDFTCERLLDMARRVAELDEPVQYVTGHARFCGLDLHVTPDVLIPRPETEGLVDRIVDKYRDRRDLRVLDLCTGSGCIAIALARALPFCRVTAVDISGAALEVAKGNAERLGTRNIDFVQADALHLAAPAPDSYDIIVSNPPYVADSERDNMSDRVLLYEPAQALFVPDADPMRFYRPIAAYASVALAPGGSLWFEINSLYDAEVRSTMQEAGFADVDVELDFYSRPRYASAVSPQ